MLRKMASKLPGSRQQPQALHSKASTYSAIQNGSSAMLAFGWEESLFIKIKNEYSTQQSLFAELHHLLGKVIYCT